MQRQPSVKIVYKTAGVGGWNHIFLCHQIDFFLTIGIVEFRIDSFFQKSADIL